MMMEEDEEETVVSKKSALYSYLLTADEPDKVIKAEKDAILEQMEEDQAESAIGSTRTSIFTSMMDKFYSSFRRILAFLPGFRNKDGWQNPRRWYATLFLGKHESDLWQMQTISRLIGSNLLDEDDEAMLKAELEVLTSRDDRAGATKLDAIRSVGRPKLPKLHFLPLFGLIPYAISRHYWTIDIAYVLDALVAIVSLGSGFRLLSYRSSINESTTIEYLLEKCKSMDATLRKALRTIRDYEVLARGYTVVTRYTVLTNKSAPDSDISPCPQLRKSVLLAVEELFTYFRNKAIELSRRSGNIRPEGFALLAETDELAEMFGDYSKKGDWRINLNALQTCCYCMTLQRSEFLRILAVSDLNRHGRRRILSEAIKSTTKWEETLRRALLYYTSHQIAEEEPSIRRLASDPDTTPAAYDFVHSLGLHLRTALKKAIEFEEKLTNASSELPDESESVYDVYTDELTSTMTKCQACLDELRAFANHSKCKANEGQRADWQVQSANVNDGTNRNEKHVYDGTIPEIVDQVYEAFTDDNEQQTSAFPLTAPPVSDCGQFMSGRRHVLDELKSVLTVRSSLMHERELRALAARRGVTVDELLAEEESQRLKDAERLRLDETSNTNSPDAATDDHLGMRNLIEGDGGCTSLATELARAIQLKGFNRRNQETILGEEDDGDEED